MDKWLFVGICGGVLVLLIMPTIVYLRYYLWGIPLRRPRRWWDYPTRSQRFAAMLAEPVDITPFRVETMLKGIRTNYEWNVRSSFLLSPGLGRVYLWNPLLVTWTVPGDDEDDE